MEKISLLILIAAFIIFVFIFFSAKSLEEKLMALSTVNNYSIVLLCFFSLFKQRESFIDIAYILGLFGFLTNFIIYRTREGKQDD